MQIIRSLWRAAHPLIARGVVLKQRRAWLNGDPWWSALKWHSAAVPVAESSDRIVIVGIGIAALSFARALRTRGFANVTIVARDTLFGGTCVNWGCMPAELMYTSSAASGTSPADRLPGFIGELRSRVEDEFRALGYPIVTDAALDVVGQTLRLASAATIRFDRLVLASGASASPPPHLPVSCGIEDFWSLQPGRLVVVADRQPNALALADLARARGLEAAVVFLRPNTLQHLPSMQYFTREVQRRGVRVIGHSRWVRAEEGHLLAKQCGTLHSLPYDHLMWSGRTRLNLLPIDGVRPGDYDVDLATGSLPHRPDITIIGDASGVLTAAEAEVQAQQVVGAWCSSERLDLQVFHGLPQRFHAQTPLVILGEPWTLASCAWDEVDFRELGWSAIHGKEGKLWFRFDAASRRIEALHLCHPDAAELGALGGLLMQHPIDDACWTASYLHPSAAEIFSRVAERVRAAWPKRAMAVHTTVGGPDGRLAAVLSLPPLHEVACPEAPPEWIAVSEVRKGVLSRDPETFFAALLAARTLARHIGMADKLISIADTNEGLRVTGLGSDAAVHMQDGAVLVTCAGHSVLVRYPLAEER